MWSISKVVSKAKRRYIEFFVNKLHGGIENTNNYQFSNGKSLKVKYFSDPDSITFGQKVPFTNSIILNEPIFSNFSQMGQEYILYHELSHKNRNPIVRGIYWGIILTGAIILGLTLNEWLKMALGIPNDPKILFVKTIISIVILLTPIRLEEIAAEIQALRRVGKDTYSEVHSEFGKSRKTSITGKLLRMIMYANPKWIKRIDSYLRKLGI